MFISGHAGRKSLSPYHLSKHKQRYLIKTSIHQLPPPKLKWNNPNHNLRISSQKVTSVLLRDFCIPTPFYRGINMVHPLNKKGTPHFYPPTFGPQVSVAMDSKSWVKSNDAAVDVATKWASAETGGSCAAASAASSHPTNVGETLENIRLEA